MREKDKRQKHLVHIIDDCAEQPTFSKVFLRQDVQIPLWMQIEIANERVDAEWRRRLWIYWQLRNALRDKKIKIPPTINPSREHWLKRFVDAYCDGEVKRIEGFVERLKDEEGETEV